MVNKKQSYIIFLSLVYLFSPVILAFISFGTFDFHTAIHPKDLNTKTDEKVTSKKDLARVAIIDFVNNTGSKNYQYLKGSLSDAVDIFMQKSFEYTRIEPKRVNRIATRLLRQYDEFEEFSEEDLKLISRRSRVDVIIYGSYSLDKQTREIIITTKVHLAFIGITIEVQTLRSKVDSTLFQVIDIIANNLVEKIKEMSSSGDTEQASDKTESGKIVLTKESLTRRIPKYWPPSPPTDFLLASTGQRNNILIINKLSDKSHLFNATDNTYQNIPLLKAKSINGVYSKNTFAICTNKSLSLFSGDMKIIKEYKGKCFENITLEKDTFLVQEKPDKKFQKFSRFDYTGNLLRTFQVPRSSDSNKIEYVFNKKYIAAYNTTVKRTDIYNYLGDKLATLSPGADHEIVFLRRGGYALSRGTNIQIHRASGKIIRKITLPLDNNILYFDINVKKKQIIAVTPYYVHLISYKNKKAILLREEKLKQEYSGLTKIHFSSISNMFIFSYAKGTKLFFQFAKRGYKIYHHMWKNKIGIPADYEINSYKLVIKRIVASAGSIDVAKIYFDVSGLLIVASKGRYEILGEFPKFNMLLRRDRFLREQKKSLKEIPGLFGQVLQSHKEKAVE